MPSDTESVESGEIEDELPPKRPMSVDGDATSVSPPLKKAHLDNDENSMDFLDDIMQEARSDTSRYRREYFTEEYKSDFC